MDKISLVDLKSQYRSQEHDINMAIKRVLEKQSFILGEDVAELEARIAEFCNTKYAVGLNSGTDALILALDAFDIKKGDEVITTPFTFVATAEAIVRVGATPVFVDIVPETYNINPKLIEKKITKKTKAILPVHLYGLPADMDPIMELAAKHNLVVIEDCCQAIGAAYHGKIVGSIGDAGALSFFPSKNLGCFGDGGMIVTNHKKVYDRVRMLREHGSSVRYYHDIIGYNSRLDNLQAAILNVKLNKLNEWIQKRAEHAAEFTKHISRYPVKLPVTPKGLTHTFHLYMIRTNRAKELMEFLSENNIDSRAYYPLPLHLQKCFEYLGYKRGDFPESEKASNEILNIPVYQELTAEIKKYMMDKIDAFFRK